jgi:hypothetical protein
MRKLHAVGGGVDAHADTNRAGAAQFAVGGIVSIEELDPEIIADLRKRAATEHDATRSRGDGVYDWSPAAIVEQWPCRTCGLAMVGVTAEQVEAREVFNRKLRARREQEIPKSAVVFCEACLERARQLGAERRARERVEMAALIRELRSLVDNDLREKSILARLRVLGHPDVDELQRAAAASRAARKTKRTGI